MTDPDLEGLKHYAIIFHGAIAACAATIFGFKVNAEDVTKVYEDAKNVGFDVQDRARNAALSAGFKVLEEAAKG